MNLRLWLNEYKLIVKFVGKAFLFFLFFYVFHLCSVQFLNWDINDYVVNNLVWNTGKVLTAVGYKIFLYEETGMRVIGIDGSNGVWIGYACNGVSLWLLFSSFLFAFPGKWLTKLWYIPAGVLAIHYLNVIRIVLLSYMSLVAPNKLEFNHTYTFQITIYAAIMALWYLYVVKFSTLKKQ